MHKNNILYLASQSPRREDILSLCGIPYIKLPSKEVDETPEKRETPRELTKRLAVKKAQAYVLENTGQYMLTADTVVGVGRRILGKPKDSIEAKRYLQLLSGRTHRVYGALCITNPKGEMIVKVSETRVVCKHMHKKEIETYLNTGEWKGVAGGYRIQGIGALYIQKIIGSYYTVMGLDIALLYRMLLSSGFTWNII